MCKSNLHCKILILYWSLRICFLLKCVSNEGYNLQSVCAAGKGIILLLLEFGVLESKNFERERVIGLRIDLD